jgi:DNA replication and repair protein RecF
MANFKITKLQVTNFRNLQPDIVTFSDGINCIFGKNGNGKTNLLEAIYVLINHKSFRKNTTFPQLLGMDGEKTEILFSSVFSDDQEEIFSYSGKVLTDHALWFLNDKQAKKKVQVPIVLINPYDSVNFFLSAQFRRHWFDYHFSQLSEEYRQTLRALQLTIKFRNKLLATRPLHYRAQIEALLPGLARDSFQITEEKKIYLKDLETGLTPVFKSLFDESLKAQVELNSEFKNRTAQQISHFYQQNLSKDEYAGCTTTGVHRDDYEFLLNGMNFQQYASLGQQKSVYLGLVFAYIELFRYKFKTYPIVLIDDISGELDVVRWCNLIAYLRQCHFQALITTANEKFREELEKIEQINKITIVAGVVKNI